MQQNDTRNARSFSAQAQASGNPPGLRHDHNVLHRASRRRGGRGNPVAEGNERLAEVRGRIGLAPVSDNGHIGSILGGFDDAPATIGKQNSDAIWAIADPQADSGIG